MNVSQRTEHRRPFTVDALRQFVDQANRQRLPDATVVTCSAHLDGSIYSLTTHATGGAEASVTHVTPEPGEVDQDGRTTIERSSTGPVVSYRYWLRTRTVRELLLGDVRALLAEIYDARLPVDRYEIAAEYAAGTNRQKVYRISARPIRTTSAT